MIDLKEQEGIGSVAFFVFKPICGLIGLEMAVLLWDVGMFFCVLTFLQG